MDTDLDTLVIALYVKIDDDTAIWHNHRTGQPVTRSLTAYDH